MGGDGDPDGDEDRADWIDLADDGGYWRSPEDEVADEADETGLDGLEDD